MSSTASKIKQIEGLLGHGADLPTAISITLGCTLAAFASRNGVRRQEVYMCLGGYHQRPYEAIRDAICAELEIPREYLDRHIDSHRAARAAEVA